MEGRPKGLREVGASGGCCACKRPWGGAQRCICGNCLALADEGLGGLRAKVQELKVRSTELQASLQTLVENKVGWDLALALYSRSDTSYAPQRSHSLLLFVRHRP